MNDKLSEEPLFFAGGDNIREYYKRYLLDVCNLSQSSVNHYLDALNHISKRLRDKQLIQKDIFEIGSLEQLDAIWETLKTDNDFIQLNKRGHQMYSAGYSRYHEFASGQKFSHYRERISHLDIPVPAENPTIMEYTVWKRSGILRMQAIECANFACELDANHSSFLAENTRKPYMEAHHAIPLHLQNQYKTSLDVYANLVCLCPICHRKIHHGLLEARREMADIIYEKRQARLIHSGLSMSKEDFERIITGNQQTYSLSPNLLMR